MSSTLYETDQGLAFLTFNRPEARNALTWEMYDALFQACERVDADPAVHALILRGAGGRAFAAGTDISQFRAFEGPEDALEYERRLSEVFDRLERVEKPTIAQVEGVAAGGGCVIALACDLRIATPDATFGIPIARTLGNCLSAATCSRLLEVIGPGRLKDLLFTGRFLDAGEALTVGFINRIEPAASMAAAVRAYAREIGSNAPLTIRATKEAVRRLLARRRLIEGEDGDLIRLCYESADFREGVASFLANRRPTWTGR